jgi:hypothetical protein
MDIDKPALRICSESHAAAGLLKADPLQCQAHQLHDIVSKTPHTIGR